jgi:hypothetical protein
MKKSITNATTLSKKTQAAIRGGAWPSLRNFRCVKNGVTTASGCSQFGGFAAQCCTGGQVVWGLYGCPAQSCNN